MAGGRWLVAGGGGTRRAAAVIAAVMALCAHCVIVAVVAGVVQPARVLAAVNTDDEIVYRDPNGFLRVVDPRPTSLSLAVTWVSPEGGWVDFALGDFNADGDSEIVAIKSGSEGTGILTVFDPVALNVGEGHDRFVGGVPWDVLYTTTLSGPPLLVTTGAFDPSRPGDEIVYIFRVPEAERVDRDDPWRVVVLRSADADAPGREFEIMASFDTGVEWTWMAAGDIGGDGKDEVALIDEVEGNLSLYRVTDTFERIYRNVSRENTWQAAVFGQFTAGGAEELAAVREERFPLASLLVFRWDGATLADVVADVLVPGPNFVFMADIGGNGDQEVVMLRRVRQEVGARPRFVVRDDGNDSIALRELLLDGDNGYQSGAAGDIDGDGRDEIAIMRDSRIRLFPEPERSGTFEEIVRSTDSKHIAMGNIDANGLADVPRLGVSRSEIELTLRAGVASEPIAVTVADVTTASALPISARVEGGSSWAELQLSSTLTPLTLNISFNAANLQPGRYTDRVIVDAVSNDVLDDPQFIALVLHVESGISIHPEVVAINYYPCAGDLPLRSALVEVNSSGVASYIARLAGEPVWADVEPKSGTLPAILTVTVDPEQRPSGIAYTDLELVVDLPNAPGIIERVPVVMTCASHRLLMPAVPVD